VPDPPPPRAGGGDLVSRIPLISRIPCHQVWFSNRRARLRKHAGSIAHSVASLPLTPCQYASHELAQLAPQVPQMPGGIPQVPTTLHHSPTTTLHQATSGGVHQAAGSAAIAQMATTMATQVPTTMSGALQGHAVAISGHLGSLPAHAASMQLAQVSTMQPPAAHSAPTSLSHNTGEHRLVLVLQTLCKAG